ncbi:MAG: hypothetical protein QOC92_808 [Acidimicrobiaceae bacterium]|jgi:DNA-binding NarL/FixJ family response regulator/class 3 adenylate cyclase
MRGGSRFLATVMVTDVVESTARAEALGDLRWRKLLDRHDAMVRRRLKKHAGREVKMMGDGVLATFEAPAQAVTCASEILDGAAKLGLDIRAGLHTGECEERDGDVGGIAVHIASRIANEAMPGEIVVSSTVRDLVTGSGIAFASRGSRALKGVSGRWQLFAVGLEEEQAATPARVLLVDDHPLWRQTLRGVLEHEQVGSVVGEAADGTEAITIAAETNPDVIVMDIDMPGMGGVEATRRILEEGVQARVLVLSSSDERSQVLEAVRAGASGYLLKTARSSEITDGVRRIHAGEVVFPPSLADVVLEAVRRRDPANDADVPRGRRREPLDDLTPREREALALMAEGRSNQAICARLHVSAKTVEGYIGSIFSKLGLETATDDHRRVLAVITYLSARSPQG